MCCRHFTKLLICTVLLLGSHVGWFVAAQDRDVAFDEFVWFTAIRSLINNKFRCSGSWIGSRYILTAAHCFSPNLKVQIGYWCRNPDNCGRVEEEILVNGAFFHSSPQAGTPGGDSAILVLRHAVQTIRAKPAIPYLGPSLDPWTKPLRKGRKMTIVGAGRSVVSLDDVSVNTKKLKVKYLRPRKCAQRIIRFDLAEFEICSKPRDGSPCPGDSGSALVVPGRGRWKGRDVILAVHNQGPASFAACSDTVADRTLVHFDMTSAVDFARSVVCQGDFLEDWCTSPMPTPSPTAPQPSSGPTEFPPFPAPTATPTRIPGMPTFRPFPSSQHPTFASTFASTAEKTPSPSTSEPTEALPPLLKQRILHSFERHSGTVYSVSFKSDGSRLVSGGAGNGDLMNVWNPLLGGGASAVHMDSSTVFAAKWNPLSNVVAAGLADGRLRLWNVDAPDETPIDLGGADRHKDAVRSVAWHPDGNLLISGSYDATIRIWNTLVQTQVSVISAHVDQVRSVAFRPDGAQFASASDDATIKLWRGSDPYDRLRVLRGHSRAVREVAYSPNGRFLASASLDGSVRVWRVSNGELMHEFLDISKVWMLCVAWSPNGKYIVSGSADGLLRVWDAEEGGEALLVLEGHFNSVWSVEWSPDGVHIASGSTDEVVIVWKIEAA